MEKISGPNKMQKMTSEQGYASDVSAQCGVAEDTLFAVARQIIARLIAAKETLETVNSNIESPMQSSGCDKDYPGKVSLKDLLEQAVSLASGVADEANNLAAKVGQ